MMSTKTTMNTIDQISRESSQLPPEAQFEVLDFVRFLHSKMKQQPIVEEDDELTRLLSNPLQVKAARPLHRDEIYDR
jgi:hypothetical protein